MRCESAGATSMALMELPSREADTAFQVSPSSFERQTREEPVNTVDGLLKWHYTANGGVATTPVSYNSAIYFISGVGRIHAVNTESGDSIGGVWKNGTQLGVDAGGAAIADAGVANGIIYYVTTNEILHAIDLGTSASAL